MSEARSARPYWVAVTLALLASCGRLEFTTLDGATDGDGSQGTNDGGQQRRLYVIGGGLGNWGQTDPANASITDVIAADILPDGSLGAWEPGAALPDPYVHDNPAVAAGRFTYVVGEYGTTSSGPMPPVLFAELATGSAWTMTTPLSPARGGYQALYGAATDGTSLYVAGGDPGGTLVHKATLIPSGGVGAWTAVTALPRAATQVAVFIAGNQLYVLGAAPASSGNLSVFHAALGGAGPIAWIESAVTTVYPGFYAATVQGSHMYIIGGTNVSNGAMTTVSYASFDVDGTLTPFATLAPLPQARANACAVAGSDAIYVIGGEPGSGLAMTYDSVYYATPAADGSIGSWKQATPLPTPRSGVSCVIQ